MKDIAENIKVLENELNWFEKLIERRFNQYFSDEDLIEIPELPPAQNVEIPYWKTVKDHSLTEYERIFLILSMIPLLKPQLLDVFYTKNKVLEKPFTEFGGVFHSNHSGFIPTVETANFLLADRGLNVRTDVFKAFSSESKLIKNELINFQDSPEENSLLINKPFVLNHLFLNYFITGEMIAPENLEVFPAKKIDTELDWNDLIISETVREEVDQLCKWIVSSAKIKDFKAVKKYIKPGFRSLFYGPPGTGKTLTASLIGKETGLDVYRIDLSMIVSKYIGETEKNLSKVFDYAEKRNWILFFDEADALFGKRTQTSSSNDRYANQEVAYLLQRLEDFPGIVLLASNLKSNIDEAFSRRFQSMIYFPMPDKQQRLHLWKNMFAGEVTLDPKCNLQEIADEYELSGGSAINVFRYGLLKAMGRDSFEVEKEDLINGIRKEYQKYGRTL